MRLVLYNIRYGTGTGWKYHFPVPFSGCLRKTGDRFRRITGYVSELAPDIVGLVEADSGSYRQDGKCQAQSLADSLGGRSVFACKYHGESIVSRAPILKSQGNAVVAKIPMVSAREHYLSRGVKRGFLEVEFPLFTLFLVHLSLGGRARMVQMGELRDQCRKTSKPAILAGDGNTFGGGEELGSLLEATGFRNANQMGCPTYPSRHPALALDFILYSQGIEMVDFSVPRVRFSDHLPLVCDFLVA